MDGGRAFLLDFDHTLFDTDRFFWVDVPAAFSRFAIDPKVWEESYARVWPTGYSLEKHLEHLAREGAVGSSDVVAIQRVLREHFADLRAYLFADVEPFLKQLQEEKIPCFLLSFGILPGRRTRSTGRGLLTSFKRSSPRAGSGPRRRWLRHSPSGLLGWRWWIMTPGSSM